MTKPAINDVQSFLTFMQSDGDRVYQIVNVELLLRRHPPDAVIAFLQELNKDYGKALSKLIQEDKTSSRINELVAKRFRISNINQLQLAAARYSTIGAFLEYADSFTDETVGDDKEGVSLMTVHKAKGLEFAVVFVIGLVEGLMPSGKGNLEEERRICFVAISRAMKLLFVSYPLNYLGQPSKKSMFLDEMLGKRDVDLQKSAA